MAGLHFSYVHELVLTVKERMFSINLKIDWIMRKTNRKWSVLSMMMVALMSFCLLSCNNDDEKDSSSGIVGTWSCNNHYYDHVSSGPGTDTFTFKSNGTYEWQCRGWESQNGRYSYNRDSGILTITNQKGTTWIYIIVSMTESYFVMMDEEGDSYTYNKK